MVGFILMKFSSWSQIVRPPRMTTITPENHRSGETLRYLTAEKIIAATIAIMKAPVATNSLLTAGTGARKLTAKKTSSGPRSISSLDAPCGSDLVLIPAAIRQWRGRRRADRTGGGHRPARRRRWRG